MSAGATSGRPRRLPVTLVVAMRNEERDIEACVRSVLEQGYAGRIELLVADGRSTDRSRQIVSDLIGEAPHARLIDNPAITQSAGWNLGIDQATGDVVGIVSGHATLANDYVSAAVDALERTGADMVGGPVNAISAGVVGRAIALATSSPFGVGGARFRYATTVQRVDTVFMGVCRRELYQRLRFDESMVRNQDDELSYRLLDQGGTIICDPTIRSSYRNRSTFLDLGRQYFDYGFWKVRVMTKHPRQVRPRHLIPAVFVATLIATAALAPFADWAPAALLLTAGAYALANLGASIVVGLRARQPVIFQLVAIAYAILHVAYGAGVLRGLAGLVTSPASRTR